MKDLWQFFIDGFCKVELLCFTGDPNWLGWIVLVIGGLISAFILFLAVYTLCWIVVAVIGIFIVTPIITLYEKLFTATPRR